MENGSVWEGARPALPELEGDMTADAVVVGGGLAGIMTAYELSSRGAKVVLADASDLLAGTTPKATAKVTAAQGTIYADLRERYGPDVPAAYYAAQRRGMEECVRLAERYSIDCDLTEADGYVFTRGGGSELDATERVLRDVGAEVERTRLPGAQSAPEALRLPGQYAIDPLKFALGLPRDYAAYSRSPALSLDFKARKVRFRHGSVTADVVVSATRYPFSDEKGGYAMKLRPSMAFSMAVSERLTDGLVLEDREDGLSLRPYSGGTIICGADCRTGRATKPDRYERIEREVRGLYGGITPTHRWCAEDCMTFDGMPMVGKYAEDTDNVFVATGFNKWGMANSVAAAGAIADMAEGKPSPLPVFDPARHIRGALGATIVNAINNMLGLIHGLMPVLRGTESIARGEARVARSRKGVCGVYRDLDGRLHYAPARCPHMGCRLSWDPSAMTWDCPCHGSRFDVDGNPV